MTFRGTASNIYDRLLLCSSQMILYCILINHRRLKQPIYNLSDWNAVFFFCTNYFRNKGSRLLRPDSQSTPFFNTEHSHVFDDISFSGVSTDCRQERLS